MKKKTKKSPLFPVTIPRSKWYRGKPAGSALLCGPRSLEYVKEERCGLRGDISVAKRSGTAAESYLKANLKALAGPVVGQMCCLGHVCKALGVSKAQMRDVGLPDGILPAGFDKPTQERLKDLIRVQQSAIDANDKVGGDEKLRERKIKEILLRAGFKVRFVD